MINARLKADKHRLKRMLKAIKDLNSEIGSDEYKISILNSITQGQEIKQLEFNKLEKLKLRNKRLQEIAKLEFKINNFDFETKMVQSLKDFNYTTQHSTFYSIISERQYGAFIIEGSKHCGQSLLLERLLQKIGISTEKEDRFELDFSSQVSPCPCEGNIWEKIREINNRFSPSSSPESLAKLIYENHLAEEETIIVFRNVHVIPPKRCLKIIEAFWFELLDSFKKLNNGTIPSDIYLFVIDKDSHYKCSENHDYVSHKYLSLISDDIGQKHEEYSTHLLPIIEPLSETYWEDWQRPFSIKEIKDKLPTYDDIKEEYVLKAIKKICLRANLKDVYKNQFKQYK